MTDIVLNVFTMGAVGLMIGATFGYRAGSAEGVKDAKEQVAEKTTARESIDKLREKLDEQDARIREKTVEIRDMLDKGCRPNKEDKFQWDCPSDKPVVYIDGMELVFCSKRNLFPCTVINNKIRPVIRLRDKLTFRNDTGEIIEDTKQGGTQ